MQERVVTIKNRLGLHARPAALFVQIASRYKSKIRVFKGDQEVDGKSIMGLLVMAAECGSSLRLVADGEDEQVLLDKLTELIEKKFFEE